MKTIRNQVIISHIKRRINNNKNAMILVIGDTGSGKSYATLRIAQKLQPHFKIKFVEFNVKGFLELVRGDYEKGQPMIFDEVGVGMGAREWQSRLNKIMSYILQTFRFKNYIVFFTVPDASFVDVHARKLFHYLIESRSINYKTKVASFKFRRIQVNRHTGNIYYKAIRFYDVKGALRVAPSLRLNLPTENLVRLYEEKRQIHMDKLYDELSNEIKVVDKQVRRKTRDKASCSRCGHVWHTRVDKPRHCPNCQGKQNNITIIKPTD